jgi:class 3 adenylate cyclase
MLNIPEEDIDRITSVLYRLLKGRTPAPIALPEGHPENEVAQLVGYVNALIADQTALAGFATALSRGNLDAEPPAGSSAAVQALKNLHANLRHLTWKTQQIATGDFSQQVDFMGGFSEAFNSMTRQLAEAREIILAEKEKSEALLRNILPAHIAEQLKETGSTVPELFDNVTVYFSDLVGFTTMSSRMDPQTLIAELNDIFTNFDNIIEAHHCERIKTIGDAYLAVCGMPLPDRDHARNMVRSAVEMVRWLEARNAAAPHQWRMRVGIHTGPVVGAVVGVKKYIYDVFGDTINTASRMESNSEPMRINLSEATHGLVRDEFAFVERPALEVKGKGAMRMYFVESAR